MLDSQCSTPATPEDGKSFKRSLEKHSKMDGTNLVEAQKRKKINRFSSTNQQPRWHNQAYMLFLALRQHNEKTMARTDLIRSALAIDKRISEERLVPKVFRGKTPMNSASAILTNNSDRYFIPFKPDGSKSMHFRLSFEPGNFEDAFKEYVQWQDNLVQNDWPYCFGAKTQESMVEELQVLQEYPTEFDEFIAKRKRARCEATESLIENKLIIREKVDTTTDIPKRWEDILSLKKSTGSANDNYSYYNNNNYYGLFASRKLPKDTPLGFYFGVPMTEDEFDSMKDGIGQASDYSYMYRKTVIDPTDENGRIYYFNGGPLCPFHYIKETSIPEKVNVVFYEGDHINQIICWTKKDISPGDELFSYYQNNNCVSSLVSHHLPPIKPQQKTTTTTTSSTATNNDEYWKKEPSISSMLNATIPIQ